VDAYPPSLNTFGVETQHIQYKSNLFTYNHEMALLPPVHECGGILIQQVASAIREQGEPETLIL
jgi:hypothetical protein